MDDREKGERRMGKEALVRRAQNGEKDAFIRLMREHELVMYRTAKAVLKTEADVEDAVQETICKAFSRLADLRQPRYFKTWLTRILLNCCYDLLRQKKGEVPLELLPEAFPAGGWSGGESDRALDVQAALDAMDPEDRLLLTLYYLNDLPIREISHILSLNENIIKKRLARGRKRFQAVYRENEAEEEAVYEN